MSAAPAGSEVATLAGGCFWCVEAPYSLLKGVHSATSGYIGGRTPSPTYEEVCSGTTGHAEAVRIVYDPSVVTYDRLLDVFFTVHDPTQLNYQGNDRGTQYRSHIFTHSAAQHEAARAKIAALDAAGKLPGPVVTQLSEASAHVWYDAEKYHQGYVRVGGEGHMVTPSCSCGMCTTLPFVSTSLTPLLPPPPTPLQCRLNPTQGYVRAVSLPKLAKVRKELPELFRE